MLLLHKTESSQFCKEIFYSGKGYDISKHNFAMAYQLISEGYDENTNNEAVEKLDDFVYFINQHRLLVNYFFIGFDEEEEKYCYCYNIESKIHKENQAFNCGGILEDKDIPFVFYPQIFSSYFAQIMDSVKYSDLEQMAIGN